jgi:hypothetical protein
MASRKKLKKKTQQIPEHTAPTNRTGRSFPNQGTLSFFVYKNGNLTSSETDLAPTVALVVLDGVWINYSYENQLQKLCYLLDFDSIVPFMCTNTRVDL